MIIGNKQLIVKKHQRNFVSIMVITQFVLIGVFSVIPVYTQSTQFNIKDFRDATFVCILILIGFGLAKIQSHQTILTTLISNLLFLAIVCQLYFVIDFIQIKIFNFNFMGIAVGYNQNSLSEQEISIVNPALKTNFNCSLVDCFRCAFGLMIAYSIIPLKGSHFIMYIFIIIGLIFYILTSQSLFHSIEFIDIGDHYKNFIFCTIYGIITSFIIEYKVDDVISIKKKQSSEQIKKQNTIGILIIWSLIPFLTQTNQKNSNVKINYTNFITLSNLGLCSSFIANTITKLYFDKFPSLASIGMSILSGAIVSGLCVIVITKPFEIIFITFIASWIQVLIEQVFENYKSELDILNKIILVFKQHSQFTFLILPAIQGAFWNCIFSAFQKNPIFLTDSITTTNFYRPSSSIISLFICISFGLISGAIAGCLIKYFSTYNDTNYIKRLSDDILKEQTDNILQLSAIEQ